MRFKKSSEYEENPKREVYEAMGLGETLSLLSSLLVFSSLKSRRVANSSPSGTKTSLSIKGKRYPLFWCPFSVLFQGFHIPKGSVLFLDSYVLHLSEDFWENPEAFDPARWDDKMAVRTFSFLPFGGGSRRCAGQPFAVVQMKAVTALILRNFSLKLDKSKPISTKVELAFGPREIHFFATKRS